MSNNNNMHTVAVYGTLRMGHGNNRLLTTSKLLSEERTDPEWNMYHLGGFPALEPGGETAIAIEVYEVDDDTLDRLDSLEGYPTFYNRKQIKTSVGDAWIYFMEDVDYSDTIITSGDWNEKQPLSQLPW